MKDNIKNKLVFKDIEDFKTFFDLYYPSLYVFATNIVLDSSIAEDLVQETFIRLWEHLKQFKSEHAAKSFLYTTLKNKCLNHIEHIKVIKKHEEHTQIRSINITEINDKIIEEETHRLIYNAINELPNQCKKVLLLSMNGLKNIEIAEELNISENTVKTQKKIAYKQLKFKLKDIYSMVGLLIGNLL